MRVADTESVGFVWSLKFIVRYRTRFFIRGSNLMFCQGPRGLVRHRCGARRRLGGSTGGCRGGGPPPPHAPNGSPPAPARFRPPQEAAEPMDRARTRGGHRVERVV